VNPWARVAILIAMVLLLLLFISLALIDLYLERHRLQPISRRVHRWGRRHALMGAGLVFVVGALTTHFFWQP
jgi:hypothetical protein